MQFATCEVNRGLEFINKMYPSKADLTKDDVPLICELLSRDILRVQDPDFHQPCQVVAGTKYDQSRDTEEVNAAVQQLKNHPKITGESL
jgi:hypothetical protein